MSPAVHRGLQHCPFHLNLIDIDISVLKYLSELCNQSLYLIITKVFSWIKHEQTHITATQTDNIKFEKKEGIRRTFEKILKLCYKQYFTNLVLVFLATVSNSQSRKP